MLSALLNHAATTATTATTCRSWLAPATTTTTSTTTTAAATTSAVVSLQPLVAVRTAARLSERERAAREREREKARAAREREREKKQRERERAKAAAAKERERAAKLRLRARADAAAEKKRAARDAQRALDAERPRRASTPYNLFVKANFARLAAEHPELKGIAVAAVASQRWRVLDDAERRPFIDDAAVDRARYERERDAFRAKYPKRPAIGFALYVKQSMARLRAEHAAGTPQADLMRAAAAGWRALSDDEKQQYRTPL